MTTRSVIFVSAENGALPGGKVGGVGDVVRDLPAALADRGWRPTVLTPGYGLFGKLPGAAETDRVDVGCGGTTHSVRVLDVPGPDERIRHLALEHAAMSPQGPGRIYCNDGPDRPFATDAGKFALFAAAAARLVARQAVPPDVVHLHDWHAALYALLRQFGPDRASLRRIRTVFTIHNLAYQGIRPLAGDISSLAAWFPDLDYPKDSVVDPRYPDCVNPMATAIRLVERISTVSPTYAIEIQQPDAPARGFHGGEGLEHLLQGAAAEQRLVGILNGCPYPRRRGRRAGWPRVRDTLQHEVTGWQRRGGASTALHDAALARLAGLPGRRPHHVLTSIGRLTAQKVALFLQPEIRGKPALEVILERLGGRGILILLGSGEPQLAGRFAALARHHDNFLFLCGYGESCAELLYAAGNLFLMPSSFEPCGISQLLAMREGQPCVVHAVGGLKDSVQHDRTGFVFDGDNPAAQAGNFVAAVDYALTVREDHPARWRAIRDNAAAQRFRWRDAAQQYIERLYD